MSTSTVDDAADHDAVTRCIWLAELDELCHRLTVTGHVPLATRVRRRVNEHEQRALSKNRATTRATFVATAAEARPLSEALAIIRRRPAA